MIDKTTVVCYLKGADDVMLPMLPYNIPWNSKKWRVLLFFGENWNIVFAGRQYPFTSKAGLDITLEHLFGAFKLPSDRYSHWHNDYIDDIQGKERRYSLCTRYMPYRGRLYDYFEVVKDCKWPLHFNDLLRSSTYEDPYYIIKDNFGWWNDKNDLPKVTVGKQVKCLRCNSRRVRDADMMVCRECAERYGFYLDDEDSAVCDCCGCRIYDGDWHHVEDEILCSNCYSSETFYCPRCDCDRFNSDRRYDRVEEEYVCCYCYDDE
jgi:hypothetical protein